jgi:hypothetical protein
MHNLDVLVTNVRTSTVGAPVMLEAIFFAPELKPDISDVSSTML